jgi:hypothetical protein
MITARLLVEVMGDVLSLARIRAGLKFKVLTRWGDADLFVGSRWSSASAT